MSGVALLDVSAETYHADPCERPSLSSSIIHVLLSQSPAHAWHAHPKLNPNYVREERDTFDLGRAAHALLLEGDAGVAVVEADSWRTNAAKDAREEARAAGKVALLTHDLERVEAMAAAARRQLDAIGIDPPLLADGAAEQTITWEERGVQCRALIDWLRTDCRAVDDLKTTSRSAHPEAWNRRLFDMGCDVQAAFYRRAVRALCGDTPAFRWIVQETRPPYALSVVSPGPDVITIAEKKIDYALELWRRCLEDDEWPGYAPRVEFAYLPTWEEARWLAREEAEAE